MTGSDNMVVRGSPTQIDPLKSDESYTEPLLANSIYLDLLKSDISQIDIVKKKIITK